MLRSMLKFIQAYLVVTLLLTLNALALGPHETALIVNANSAGSLRIAREYAAMRSIPAPNVVALKTLPADPGITMTPADFEKMIWTPVRDILKTRGIDGQIQAWIYSTDFPTTISTTPPISITGMTFLQTNVPAEEEIAKALYASPLFADPAAPGMQGHTSRSFDRLKSIAGRSMPLPSFMLGFTGQRGNTSEEVLSCLKKGASADYSSPSGTVYFVKTGGVRSETREWQFKATSAELKAMNINCTILDAPPQDRHDIIGVIMGAAGVEPAKMGTFIPGAFADHLTSFGAYFSTEEQTKCTAWLKAGATGSAGAITEPFSAWSKFPHARLFVHYGAGCTLIESFYQSLRSPLQILPIGDPLCQPWAPKPSISISGIPEAPTRSSFKCMATVTYDNPLKFADIDWYLDDALAGKGDSVTIDASSLAEGPHSIRVVALTLGSVRSQGFLVKEFMVSSK